MTDIINHPAHYERIGSFECIELTRLYDFDWGNAIKYVWRHEMKHPGAYGALQDLGKAAWYVRDAMDNGLQPAPTDPMHYELADRLLRLAKRDQVAHAETFWQALAWRDTDRCVEALEHLAGRYQTHDPQGYMLVLHTLKGEHGEEGR